MHRLTTNTHRFSYITYMVWYERKCSCVEHTIDTYMPTLTVNNTVPRVASERELLVFLIDDDAAKINQAPCKPLLYKLRIATDADTMHARLKGSKRINDLFIRPIRNQFVRQRRVRT